MTSIPNYANLSQISNDTSNVSVTGEALTKFTTWYTAFCIFATLFLNSLIIIVYLRYESLRTAFNVYIVNIAIIEVVTAVTMMPGTFILGYFGYWPYEAIGCSFVQYAILVFGSINRYGHALITGNRLWAVAFPVLYRERHSAKLAWIFVLFSWIFVHALGLPTVIRGRLQMGTAREDKVCVIDRTIQFTYAVTEEVICFSVPEVFIIIAYSVILYKLHRRKMRKKNRVADGDSILVQTTVSSGPGTHPMTKEKRTTHGSHNRVLAYLVIAMVFCWTPNNVYYLLNDILNYWNTTYYAIQYFAQFTHSWLSPILCYLAMGSLRSAINQTLFWQRRP